MAARLAWVHDADSSTEVPLQMSRKFGFGAMLAVGLLGGTLGAGVVGAGADGGVVGAAGAGGGAVGVAGLDGGTTFAGADVATAADRKGLGAAGTDGGLVVLVGTRGIGSDPERLPLTGRASPTCASAFPPGQVRRIDRVSCVPRPGSAADGAEELCDVVAANVAMPCPAVSCQPPSTPPVATTPATIHPRFAERAGTDRCKVHDVTRDRHARRRPGVVRPDEGSSRRGSWEEASIGSADRSVCIPTTSTVHCTTLSGCRHTLSIVWALALSLALALTSPRRRSARSRLRGSHVRRRRSATQAPSGKKASSQRAQSP